jgi:hypothetical protein
MKNPGFLFAGFALALAAAVGLFVCAANPFDLRTEMTAAEFARCGLAKLTEPELSALGAWIERRTGVRATEANPRSSTRSLASDAADDELVAFNVSTKKFRCPSCRHALACTRNCREVPLSEALARGGVACLVCGGACPRR